MSFGLVWLAVFFLAVSYVTREKNRARFEFFVSHSGIISALQRETWLPDESLLQPGDQILAVDGVPFQAVETHKYLAEHRAADFTNLKIQRGFDSKIVKTQLRRYTKNDILVLFILPLIVSLVFLGFAIGVLASREASKKYWDAVRIFSLLCWLVSLFFVGFLPTVTLGWPFSFSSFLPLVGALIFHLFLVYPKLKFTGRTRAILLSCFYSFSVFLVFAEHRSLFSPYFNIQQFNFFYSLLGCLAGFASIANTLLTSQDFWARRRARLLSLAILGSFIAGASVFVASLWDAPRISLERILGASLVFPSAFAAIFLKENVFNVERVFRRGIHQLLLLGVGISFAVLLGWAWSESRIAPHQEWILWVMIAVVVLLGAKPSGIWFEEGIHRLIRTRVKYPAIFEFVEASPTDVAFLERFFQHAEYHLRLKDMTVSFVQDPTLPYGDSNQQTWQYHQGEIKRLFERPSKQQFYFHLLRGDRVIGEFGFEGGDSIAFDPETSREWAQTIKDLARALEIIGLREFIEIQQGLLAAGRMQALLAHHMKNPLAIIKVCAGLLQNKSRGDDESEELLRTIQNEVGRVSRAVQSVFDHSGRVGQRNLLNLKVLLYQLRENILSRFPDREIKVISLESAVDGKAEDDDRPISIWMEEEGFRQTLNNLMVNAFEAGAQKVTIEVKLSSARILFVVTDDGPGLPERLDLFKPFVTTKTNGTGLGLVHVKAFVDRNRGNIRVQSKLGSGTSFTLEFSKQYIMNEVL